MHMHLAEMIAEPAGDLAGEARVVQRQHAPRDRRALGPDDGGDVGSAARLGSGLAHIGSCANGPDGRKCSSAVLWCGCRVADGADDAGLVVGQAR